VAQHQHAERVGLGAGEPADQEVAEPFLPFGRLVRDALDLRPQGLEPRGAAVGDPVHAVGGERAAIDVDHVAEGVDVLAVATLRDRGEVAGVGPAGRLAHRAGV
jgi:hypothetical protein